MKDTQKTLQILVSIATIAATCIAAIALIPAFGEWLLPRAPVSTPDIASLAIQPPLTTEAFTSIPQSTLPSSCFVQAETALETFKKMLRIEAQAVIEGDVESFMRLYSTNVAVIDSDSGEKYDIHQWLKVNLVSHQWVRLEHYDIRIDKIAENKAWVINSVRGAFIDTNNDQTVNLDIKDGDHRLFTKDQNGCWTVTYLEINAATRSFP